MTNKAIFLNHPEVFPPNKKKEGKKTIWGYYFARRIALLITAPLFLKLKVSANQISFLSLTVGIIGTILIAIGNFWLILFSWGLIQTWLILDQTDGLVARFNKNETKFGEFFDEVNGFIITVLFFISIGFAASRFPGVSIEFFSFDQSLFIILGIFTSLFIALRHLINIYFRIIFQRAKDETSFSGRGFLNSLYKIVVKFSGVYSLAQLIFLAAIIFNFLGFYILFYFCIQATIALTSISLLIYKALKYE
jgi:phosphatidylglycerophosphate synthase